MNSRVPCAPGRWTRQDNARREFTTYGKLPASTLTAMVVGSRRSVFSIPRNFAAATGVYGTLIA